MVDILNKIIDYKRPIVAKRKADFDVEVLEKSINFQREIYSMKKALMAPNSSGIISEFKRKSPSKGIINDWSLPAEVTRGYNEAGASGISILTDTHFFGGNNQDLKQSRANNEIPILRKDFIFDEFQIIEAKSIGADIILLIAEVLTKKEIKSFVKVAKNIGLEVLLELHSLEQIEKIDPRVDIIGVNNRNLKTFEVSLEHSMEIFNQLPQGTTKISESGIHFPEDIIKLRTHGFDGFLIGEKFMKTKNPPLALKQFIQEVNNKA